MKKFINCMTHALDLENEDVHNSDIDLWYSSNPFSEISEKCKKHKRSCRLVERDETLLPGEWLVAFFGFVITKVDYDGYPEKWDYHFVRKEKDGIWTERESKYEDITFVDINKLMSDYKKINIDPLFLAIGKAGE